MLNSTRLSIFMLASIFASGLYAAKPKEYVREWNIGPMLEAKGGYFYFADSKMQSIYSDGGVDAQLSFTYPMLSSKKRYNLALYGSAEYLYCSGHSKNGHQQTEVWQIPVSVGIKPIFAITHEAQYYFAVGPRYFYFHQHNNSSNVCRNEHHNGIGFFVNTGFNLFFCRHFFFDIFGEYSYERAKVHSCGNNVSSSSRQVGGYTVGLGIGYLF